MAPKRTDELLTELVTVSAELAYATDTQATLLDRRNAIVAKLRQKRMTWVRLAEVAGVTPAALRLAARKREVRV